MGHRAVLGEHRRGHLSRTGGGEVRVRTEEDKSMASCIHFLEFLQH